MRLLITALAGLFLSANFLGCGGTTMPQPPSQAKDGPPPGTSPDQVKTKNGTGGVMPPANPSKKK